MDSILLREVFLVFVILITGISCLYFGITNTYKLNKRTKGYLITDGYYRGYDIYTKNKDGHTLYKLVYGYEVNEKQYTIATDYSINKNLLPEINSRRKIKYNPSNPSQAVVEGMNQSHFLIYFGIFFIISGSVFIFVFLSLKGLLDRFKFNILEVYMGVICFIIGIGIILFQNATTLSFLETIKTLGILMIIPFFFIVVGINLIVKNLFKK